LKALTYFFSAVILIGAAKLIEVAFYEQLKPHHPEDKEYKTDITKVVTSNEEPKSENEERVAADNTVEKQLLEEEALVDSTTIAVVEQVEEPAAKEIPKESNVAKQTAVSTEEYFQDLKNSYISPILASLPEGRSREDVVIRYYKHDNDGDRIYSLKRLGYYLHEKIAEDNIGLGSNSLYYGSDVDIRDIQVVAYELIKSGMPLRSISQSQYDWKYNSIEIGADSLVEDDSIIELDDLITLSKE
jgi:hypothetical protein